MKKTLLLSIILVLSFCSEIKSQADTLSYVTYADSLPHFVYGQYQYSRFIQINLVYPLEARRKALQGKVYVSFIVDTLGKISNKKILKDIGGGCGNEALKAIEQTSGMWTTGIHNGKKVNVLMNLPISFSCGNCSPDSDNSVFVPNTDPNYYSEYYYDRAMEDLTAERNLTAIFYFTKSLGQIPNFRDALNKRGQVKLKIKDVKGACEDWHLAQKNGDKEVGELLEKYCE